MIVSLVAVTVTVTVMAEGMIIIIQARLAVIANIMTQFVTAAAMIIEKEMLGMQYPNEFQTIRIVTTTTTVVVVIITAKLIAAIAAAATTTAVIVAIATT